MASNVLRIEEIPDLAEGCALLGSGGGGETHAFKLVLRQLLAERGPVRILDPADLADDALVVNVGFVGAPIIGVEKLFTNREILDALEGMRGRLGRPIDAVMAAEIGGGNGLTPLIAGSLLGVPVVDADGMGRAFPMSDQISYAIHGRSASPTVVATDHGDVIVLESASNRRMELLVRSISAAAGHKCFSVDYVLSGRDVRECAVLGTTTLAQRIGGALRRARSARADPIPLLQEALTGPGDLAARLLFEGKITACTNETRGGFNFGTVHASTIPAAAEITIHFQNEFLVAWQAGKPIAMTPDIISIIDADTLKPIGSEAVRYGQRIRIIAIRAPAMMRTPAALAVLGPRAFGLDVDYRPLESGPLESGPLESA